uniref:Uncharacterized protein n=1 Tax=Cacopsylla melanoneura TaxID=428564 RepID=A0A8D8PMC7_9HEMI
MDGRGRVSESSGSARKQSNVRSAVCGKSNRDFRLLFHTSCVEASSVHVLPGAQEQHHLVVTNIQALSFGTLYPQPPPPSPMMQGKSNLRKSEEILRISFPSVR